jgi:hypothetical protein
LRRGFVEFQSSLDWVWHSTPVFLFALLVIGLAELDARGLNGSDVTTFLFAPDEAVAELHIEGTRALLIDENLGRNHSCTLAGLQAVQDGRRVVLRMGREVFTYDLDDAEMAGAVVARLAPRLA